MKTYEEYIKTQKKEKIASVNLSNFSPCNIPFKQIPFIISKEIGYDVDFSQISLHVDEYDYDSKLLALFYIYEKDSDYENRLKTQYEKYKIRYNKLRRN